MTSRKSSKSYRPSRGQFAGRTFTSKQKYRTALARSKGFKSDYARRIAYRRISSTRDLLNLPSKSRQKRADALHVIRLMRNQGMNLTEAVREFNSQFSDFPISITSVKKYGKPALSKRGGRVHAKASDRILRVMRIPTLYGLDDIEVKRSKTATRLAKYENAVRTYLYTGDESQLRAFRGKYFRSNRIQYRFITDTEILDRLAEFDELSIESIYTQLEGK